MADSPTTMGRQTPTKGSPSLDLKKGFFSSPSYSFGTRKSMAFAYCFIFAFAACTFVYVLSNPSIYHSSNILKTRSPFPNFFSRFFRIIPTSFSSPSDSIRRTHVFRFPISGEKYGFSRKPNNLSNEGVKPLPSDHNARSSENQVAGLNGSVKGNSGKSDAIFSREKDGYSEKINDSSNGRNESSGNKVLGENDTLNQHLEKSNKNDLSPSQAVENATAKGSADENVMVNSSSGSTKNSTARKKGVRAKNTKRNNNTLLKKQSDGAIRFSKRERGKESWFHELSQCDFFDGKWVKDDSYPLYEAGSCPHIDEPFDCFHNGRPDNGYEKYRWQPNGCNVPRLNGRDLLEILRGKRVVYVGDSLNRNMWESMVCALRNSVEDKSKVFEASGRQEFRSEGSYSFLFQDYNLSVEFFRSTFLVQEWEIPDMNGSNRETLRIDLIDRSSDRYKKADILVFNTGHWWTHEKTSEGKGYYQEGSHVYAELDVVEAFRRAMTTWARWIEANTNPTKSLVFFRGYSVSHFSGGQWNSGGKCDSETEPLKNEAYLSWYPPIVEMMENVLKGMKVPVYYLNVTRMTDFRKDAHPSIYSKQNLTQEEKMSPLRFQDCSHWCLPGVPDIWNELIYARILIKYNQK